MVLLFSTIGPVFCLCHKLYHILETLANHFVPNLPSLSIVIAAEAIAIDIVVIVLAIVRHCKGNANREQYKMNSFIFIAEMQLTLSKGCIIILNDLQLPGIFSFIINR